MLFSIICFILNKNIKELEVGFSELYVYCLFQEKENPKHSSSYFSFELQFKNFKSPTKSKVEEFKDFQ
tara:strand:- start:31 stop:234 length:204 start_codon:yes stop_codon:yes gene_type:complete